MVCQKIKEEEEKKTENSQLEKSLKTSVRKIIKYSGSENLKCGGKVLPTNESSSVILRPTPNEYLFTQHTVDFKLKRDLFS